MPTAAQLRPATHQPTNHLIAMGSCMPPKRGGGEFTVGYNGVRPAAELNVPQWPMAA